MTTRRACLRLALTAALVIGAPALAPGQTHPEKPIRLVVPYGPGSIVDYVGRTLSQKLSEAIGQPVNAENHPGAAGSVGAATVARAAPDGTTLLLIDPAVVINPALQADVPYDLFKNLQTVSIVTSEPQVLVVALRLPVKTVPELIAYGKANPGKLAFASAGIGSTPHLAGELFKLRTGIAAAHVPYKGIAAAYTDLMEAKVQGKVQMAFSSMAAALPFTNSNGVRAIATTGAMRSSVYPELPTVAEAGVSGFTVDGWLGVFAPAGLPAPVLARLDGALTRALQTSELQAALARVGIAPRGTGPQEGAAFVRAEFEKWRQVITDAKIKYD